ncbi:MAG: formylglycine-generating enzyme family protein [Blastocatellia bacterium]
MTACRALLCLLGIEMSMMIAAGAVPQVEIVPSKSRTARGSGKTAGGVAARGRSKSKPRAGTAGRGPAEVAGPQAALKDAPAMTRPLEFSIVSPALDELKPAAAPAPVPAAKPEAAPPAASSGKPAEPAAVAPAVASAVVEEKGKPEENAGAVPEKAADPATPPAEIKPESEAPPAPRAVKVPDQVFNYEYNSITSDSRGRIVGTEKRIGRYLSEEIAAGTVLEMAEIPAGNFLMGASELALKQLEQAAAEELGKKLRERVVERLAWEGPQRVVKVKGFHMSKFEITQAQWRAVAALPKVKLELMAEPSEFRGGNLPVERVTWDEAVEFCERLSRATGRRYRLPTEAEWEYACRAGAESPFHFGETAAPAWASFNGKHPFGKAPKGDAKQQPSPVGSYGLANAFGLYDMHGNVWEWCLDNWHESHAGAPDEAHIWHASGIAYLKSLRGGAWDSLAIECRSSSRNRMTAGIRLNNIGFRVVAEAMSSNGK